MESDKKSVRKVTKNMKKTTINMSNYTKTQKRGL